MRIVRNKGYGQNPVGMIKIITPLPSQLGRIGKFITNTVWEDLEIVYPTSEDPVPAPPTPPKETKKVWRKKNKTSSTATTSPGMDETTST